PDDFLDRLHRARSWTDVADLLCEWLGIPDLQSRHGLKNAHKNFDEILGKLDLLYDFAVRTQSEELAGGVIAIYTRMFADSILRNRIFKGDFIEKLFPFLKSRACRNITLDALATATHHGGVEARKAIAAKTTLISDVLEEHIDDVSTAHFSWSVIAHSTVAILGKRERPSSAFLRALEVPRLIRLALHFMRHPVLPRERSEHIFSFLTAATHHCSSAFFAEPSAIDFMLSCTRAKNIRIRAEALSSLLRLYASRVQLDQDGFDVRKFVHAQKTKQWPRDIGRQLLAYGFQQTEIYLAMSTTVECTKSFARVAQHRDLLRLGRELGSYILRTEYAIVSGMYQVQNRRTGKREVFNPGLPFTMWIDALPHCARELRENGRLDEKEVADMLECKYFVMKRMTKEAHALSDKAITQYPQNGFFYYVRAIGIEDDSEEESLRIAKKGLKCPGLTDYVKYCLLQTSAELAAELAQRKLREFGHEQLPLEEGYAYALSAWEDAMEYLNNAPPDGLRMLRVCHMLPYLSLLLYGHEQTPDLPLVKEARQTQRLAEDTSRHIDRKVANTQFSLTAALIYDRLPGATREWDAVTSRAYGEYEEPEPTGKLVGKDGLAAWLERSGGQREHERERSSYDVPELNISDMLLYRCSWCRNPSAVLRKCKGCSRTRRVRYCDASCQGQHW
ncbi:hypothetical protein K488DRAFT_22499, partial [Vararia minispora EC-137]